MAEAAKREATYQDLFDLPENTTGEIINGELIVTPRPSRKHVYTASALGSEIGPPFQFGRGGGPGGWIILIEPEIKLGENILVPDLAGWKRGRFPASEETNWISVAPDWVCEVLSPSTETIDRGDKVPLYASQGISHAWLMSPATRVLEVLELDGRTYRIVSTFKNDERARAKPFDSIELDLAALWAR